MGCGASKNAQEDVLSTTLPAAKAADQSSSKQALLTGASAAAETASTLPNSVVPLTTQTETIVKIASVTPIKVSVSSLEKTATKEEPPRSKFVHLLDDLYTLHKYKANTNSIIINRFFFVTFTVRSSMHPI
jgi:hypothetical protein